jgi:hypothetical protein
VTPDFDRNGPHRLRLWLEKDTLSLGPLIRRRPRTRRPADGGAGLLPRCRFSRLPLTTSTTSKSRITSIALATSIRPGVNVSEEDRGAAGPHRRRGRQQRLRSLPEHGEHLVAPLLLSDVVEDLHHVGQRAERLQLAHTVDRIKHTRRRQPLRPERAALLLIIVMPAASCSSSSGEYAWADSTALAASATRDNQSLHDTRLHRSRCESDHHCRPRGFGGF